jgi:hypothetical protein
MLQERRRRAKVRAALYALNGRDLHDIGIAHGNIEYVASHPETDVAQCRTCCLGALPGWMSALGLGCAKTLRCSRAIEEIIRLGLS